MTKPMPPGVNQFAATKQIAAHVDNMANDAIKNHTGPRPPGTKTTVTAEIPVKMRRTTTAKC